MDRDHSGRQSAVGRPACGRHRSAQVGVQSDGMAIRFSVRSVAIVVFMAAMSACIVLLFSPLLTYSTISSPDGDFTVVAASSFAHSLVPAMPGQGGDKPGRVTLLRRDGRSCGSVPIEQVNMLQDLQWDLAGKPRIARIGWRVIWDLDACSLKSA
jgi:hypothetical protein